MRTTSVGKQRMERMAYTNTAAFSASTGPSSVFSSDDDPYDARIREIEEYYVKSLLNDDDEETEFAEAMSSESWSFGGSSKPPLRGYQPLGYFRSSMPAIVEVSSGSRSPKQFRNPLEVDINRNLMPSVDPLPLTTENLQRLTISPGAAKESRKSEHIANTTRSVPDSQQQLNKELYKTELCESFTTKGNCKYGNRCQFAHGLGELKFKQRSTNFRTKPCVNWTKLGYCPYGKRCCFKHGDDNDIKVYMKAENGLKASASKRPKNLHANVRALQKITW
ncbi:hypothetical protein HG536_0C01240 [Torulaspora globosa]|uniref:C3H1-type domain-containing protein n=1 Tax=Torulaspora globosa TaxID=48254 RepID=A0A7G3ZEM0_9SACH|nr:uncharacterized protein HG536_0C01240 [Torulaspora globosa]QLL31956.1 hypothetical protein HG536_0C01240 [Torulaspora globosa]